MTAETAIEEPVSLPAGETEEPPEAEEAPFGWMKDPDTGEMRPRKRPGRRSKNVAAPAGKTPSIMELQALGSLPEASEDAAPGAPPKGRRKAALKTESLPPFRAGVIAKGVNKLYRRAGRIVRMFDYDIGTAIIATTRVDPDADPEDQEDTTVGEAWENLAKTNPRVRAFLLKFMAGGAWTGLATAHLPILLAVMLKDGIRERIPLLDLAAAFLTDEPDDGGQEVPSGLSQMMGGINPDDMAQMMQMAQGLMGQMANGVPRASNVPRMPDGPREHPAGQE